MNREIKFRAWDKQDKKILKVTEINFVYKKITNMRCGWLTFDEIELMQYTGLKDSNGIEIYEGDILRVTTDSEESFIAEVKYCIDSDYPAFDLVSINKAWWFDSNVLQTVSVGEYEVRIIGNIHENPELLK